MSEILPIIVVNWNGLSDTVECIDSLLESDYKDISIFLVDNDSSDGEGVTLQSKYKNHPKVTVILNKTNLGFGGAHNQVLDNYLQDISYNYLCLINNDAIVTKNSLSKAVDFAVIENVDVLSMKMVDYTHRHKMDNAGHRLLTNGEILPIGSQQNVDAYNEKHSNVGASGGACLISKKCIEHIGLYDPFFFVGYEDAEYGLRARLTYHNCMYCPDAIVYHKGGQSIKKVFDTQYSIQTFRNIRYTNYKLLPWPVLIATAPYGLIRTCMIILIGFIIFRWSLSLVMIKSCLEFYIHDFSTSLKSRRALRKNRRLMGSLSVLRLMNSAVLNDIAKFYSIFVRKTPTAIEKYR